jgi:hypothetical protein|tara:strand:- start:307 stop:1233 length:927 start_codon:yes stop_codon:yes gene_type:complete
MKQIHLEYSDMVVNLPSIDYFIDRIKAGGTFQFVRANHGIFDLIYNAYRLNNDDFNYNEFKSDLHSKNYAKISEKVINSSNTEYNKLIQRWHTNSEKVVDKLAVFLKVFNEYNDISDKFHIGVSLGVGLNEFWGIWQREHPFQRGREAVFREFYNKRKYDYYYSGVLKYFSVTGEVSKIFTTLKECDYNVIFVGPDYMRLYKDKLNIENFHHINIPIGGAINFVDEYIEKIKDISKIKKTIVFYSIGHILTFYMAHQLKDENIIGIDAGRSFDILLKDKVQTEPTLTECWTKLDKEQLKAHINTIQNG